MEEAHHEHPPERVDHEQADQGKNDQHHTQQDGIVE